MNRRHDDLFPELEPPPGGATRLLARLDEEQRRGRRRAGALGALGGLAVAAVALFVALKPAAPSAIDPGWREAPGLVARGAGVSGDSPVTVLGAGAAMRVPTKDPSVVFYLVGSTSVIEP